jgi:glycosyltransferase involved in cell wall biosynthesis
MNPRVSVIMPVRERAAFLRAAVDSAQTETSRELLLVDDGSCVSTLERNS